MIFRSLLISCIFFSINFAANPQDLVKKVTVITATSPIKSNPKTDIIEATQKSLYLIPELRDCKKIIVFDGINESNTGYCSIPKDIANIKHDYAQFKEKIIAFTQDPNNVYFKNTTLLFLDDWKHLAWALQEAWKFVETPFVYVHQHDIQIIKPFDVTNIIRTMEENPTVKLVRAPNGENRPNWFDGPVDTYIEGISYVPLVRTFRFSDSEHLTSKRFYEELVFPKVNGHNFPDQFIMEPDFKKHQQEIFDNFKLWGMYIYGSMGEPNHLHSLDGRCSD